MADDSGLLLGLSEGIKSAYSAYNDEKDRQMRIQNYLIDRKMKKATMDMQAMEHGLTYDENAGTVTPDTNPNTPYNQKAAEDDFNKKAGLLREGLVKNATTGNPEFTPDKIREKNIEQNYKLAQTKNVNAEAAKNTALAAAGGSAGGNPVKRLTDLGNTINPNKARGGNLAKSQAMINAADRIDAIFQQFPDYNVPKAQTQELATAAAALVSGGTPQSQHQIDAIVPKSIRGDAEGIASWLTNEPNGLQQKEFMKLMHESSSRERAVAEDQVKSAQVSALSPYWDMRDNPGFDRVLRSYGIDQAKDIDENGQYRRKTKSSAAGLIGGSKPAWAK